MDTETVTNSDNDSARIRGHITIFKAVDVPVRTLEVPHVSTLVRSNN